MSTDDRVPAVDDGPRVPVTAVAATASCVVPADDFAFDDDEAPVPSAVPVRQLPPDPPVVTVFRLPTAEGIVQELTTVLASSQHAPAGAWKVLMDLQDVPASRLAKCRQFAHVVDSAAIDKAAALAAQLAAEEAQADGKELHSQLVHALTAARTEINVLKQQKQTMQIELNHMHQERATLLARLQDSSTGQSATSDSKESSPP